jgi:6-phosphogluconolactonase (cycloisomerase 2 family)
MAVGGRGRLLGLMVLLVTFGLPASAQAATVYAANQASNFGQGDVSQYAVAGNGQLSPLQPASVPSPQPLGITVTPEGEYAYAGCGRGGGSVCAYEIDQVSGQLSVLGNIGAAPGQVTGLAVSPDSKSLYATASSGAIAQYDIGSGTGTLSHKNPATVAAGPGTYGVAVSPDGKNAYASNRTNPGTVSQYTIDSVTGALSPKSPASVEVPGYSAAYLAVTPDSKSLYVGTYTSNGGAVAQYDIDPLTGTLSPKTPANVAAAAPGEGVAVSPDGKSAYVSGSGVMSQYDIDALTGTLSAKSPASVPMGVSAVAVVVSPDGKGAYATDTGGSGTGSVFQYGIDPVTGALSPLTPASVSAGTYTWGIAVGPQPAPYPRPKGAGPLRASLVIAYRACTAPNRTHGAPLSFPSCNPPSQASSFLTVGTAEANGAGSNAIGSVLYRVRAFYPGDVFIDVSTSDVRCQSTTTTCGSTNAKAGRDYTGELRATAALRLTDKAAGAGAATTQDISFPVSVPCSPTSDTSIGSRCAISTSANAIVVNAVTTGNRAIWELGQIQVYDGGSTGTAGASDATLFEDQGVFAP